ncbi:MAG: aminopeptidase, partial [Erysipelotrichaceae bacterium]|nr:aminopeptidase [Erysipelotrichaceae bacterium]
KTKWEQDSKACYLSVASDMPGALKDVDSDKLNAYQQAYYGKMADLMAYTMNNEGQWCILGVPSVEWARVVFPDLSDEEAFEKLGDAIFAVTRVSEDNDPIAEWEAHDKELMEHARKLNEYNFKELHFTSASGTDLTVGLVKDHIWAGGCGKTPEGIYFDPNMPTEEVFCMPLKTGTNGKVVASKPLSYNGKVIEDFWFRFENGKVVDFDAKKEKEALKQLLEFDEGSAYLGEVALVPYDSPVSRSGILFFDTLYDENAACHLALGRPYPENIKGGEQMSKEELLAHGANDSLQHEDFMFGTADMDIDGIKEDGSVIPIFRKGNFVF